MNNFGPLREYFRAAQKYTGKTKKQIIDACGQAADHCFRWGSSQWLFAYGKNLVDIDQEESIENTITGVYPYYKDTNGNVLELPEKVVSSASAHNFPYPRTVPLDCSQEWQETPSVEQLRAYASAYVKKEGIGVPSVSLKVSFVPLWQTEEYKAIAPAERLNLCDIATVRFEKLGVNARAKPCPAIATAHPAA